MRPPPAGARGAAHACTRGGRAARPARRGACRPGRAARRAGWPGAAAGAPGRRGRRRSSSATPRSPPGAAPRCRAAPGPWWTSSRRCPATGCSRPARRPAGPAGRRARCSSWRCCCCACCGAPPGRCRASWGCRARCRAGAGLAVARPLLQEAPVAPVRSRRSGGCGLALKGLFWPQARGGAGAAIRRGAGRGSGRAPRRGRPAARAAPRGGVLRLPDARPWRRRALGAHRRQQRARVL